MRKVKIESTHTGGAKITIGSAGRIADFRERVNKNLFFIMNDKYTLDGKRPVECEDLLTWSKWYGTANRHVAQDERKGVVVSTVFLGLDHRFGGDGPPILFETMIFGGPHDQDQDRYSTWEEAEAGHAAMCAKAFPKTAVSRIAERLAGWLGI